MPWRLNGILSPGAPPIHPEGAPTIKPNFHKNLSNVPALEAPWRGSFEVLDMDKVDSDMKLCEGFVAHSPAIVSRKAYEFSRQIAGVMQFKLHPCSNFGPEIFQAISPDVNNIALYFYPGKFERSMKKYSTLLKYIEKNNLVMRSQMGSVELFVFASKLLPLESQSDFSQTLERRIMLGPTSLLPCETACQEQFQEAVLMQRIHPLDANTQSLSAA
ncbi:unnamed protein product [Dovyalis caffra]|uniref:AIPP2-like SPOC-like domain-containing protein n=1 Tax=Dovyalis caffra TaxID=77055 RepID=A0AAV1QWN9_9ROSI|nr:unnamed protein product [Dovyalis caffra]